MRKPIISFVGAGKLGKVLANLFNKSGVAQIGGLYNKTFNNAVAATKFIDAGIPCKNLSEIPASDVIFITTPDDEIKKTCDLFSTVNKNQPNKNLILLHCSGSQPSETMNEARKKLNASLGSIHPIFSFGNIDYAVENFRTAYCSFEGDTNIYPIVKDMFYKIGAKSVFSIDANKKANYHVSGMFPGCLTAALMKVANNLYKRAGVPEELITDIVVSLLENTLKNIKLSKSIDRVEFSGPLPRNDFKTIEKHFEALKETDYSDLYKILMLELTKDIDKNNSNKTVSKLIESAYNVANEPKKKLNDLFKITIDDNRWQDTLRNHSTAEVMRLRGSLETNSNIATIGANKLWKTLITENHVPALGAITGNQAVQMAKNGLKAIYLSGWQTAADGNEVGLFPDRSLYPADSVPKLVKKLNRALQRADQIQFGENGKAECDWYVPIVADGEAGFGGVLNVYELTKLMIEAGAAGVHFEDQLPSEKKCGHLGGKVLIPVGEFIKKLQAARLAADVMGTPTILIGRTDANSAKLISSDHDPVDKPFIDNKQTGDGYFQYQGGIEASIARALAFAPYCDLIWWETGSPNIEEARQLAVAIKKVYPKKMFAYNCSPSFNWRKYLSSEEIANFQNQLGQLGFKFQFITSAGFHSLNYSMFQLAKNYKETGMSAFVELQDKEFQAAKKSGYTAIFQQKETANTYYDLVQQTIFQQNTDTMAMPSSTEKEQFYEENKPKSF